MTNRRFDDLNILNDWALGVKENGKWGFLHVKNPGVWALEPIYTDKGGWSEYMQNRALYPAKESAWTGYANEKAWSIAADANKVSVQDASQVMQIAGMAHNMPRTSSGKAPRLRPRPWHKAWKSVSFVPDPNTTDLADSLLVVRNDAYIVEEKPMYYGLTDSAGKVLVKPMYMGISMVNLNTFYMRVDTGKTTIPAPAHALFRLPDCKRMSKGVYWQVHAAGPGNDSPIIVSPFFMQPNNKRCGLLNASGEEIIPCEYEDFKENAPTTFIPAKKNDKWGLIDMSNYVLLPFEYDFIWTVSAKPDTDVVVGKGGKAGVLKVGL